MTGTQLIAEERRRQISEEGWTSAHDDVHRNGELAKAASCYASPEWYSDPRITDPLHWPGGWDWKSKVRGLERSAAHRSRITAARIRDLIKAGALIAAEIDRLQRAENGC